MFGDPLNVGSITPLLGFNEYNKFSLECGEIKDGGATVVSAYHETESSLVVGTAHNCTLIIATFDSGTAAPVTEHVLEFDNSIDALCFDPTGKCLIASDDRGYLHFVAVGDPCSLIFSHKTPITAGSRLMVLKFFPNSGAPASPLLVGVRDNGVFYSANLPVATVLKMAFNQPEALSTAVGKLAFASAQLDLPYPKRALVAVGAAVGASTCVNVFILDAYNHTHHGRLTVSGKTASVESLTPLQGPGGAPCIDMALLGRADDIDDSSAMSMLLLLGGDRRLCCFGAESAQCLFCVSMDVGVDAARIVAGSVRAVPQSGEVEAFCVAFTLRGQSDSTGGSFANSYSVLVNPLADTTEARLLLLHNEVGGGATSASRVLVALGSSAGDSVSGRYLSCKPSAACADEPVSDFAVCGHGELHSRYLGAILVGFAAASAGDPSATLSSGAADLSEVHLATLIGMCCNVPALDACDGSAVLVMQHLEGLCADRPGDVAAAGPSLAVLLELLLDMPQLPHKMEFFGSLVEQLKRCVGTSASAGAGPQRLGYYLYLYDSATRVGTSAAQQVKCFHSMVRASPQHVWEDLVRAGAFEAAAVVRARHLHSASFQPGSLLQSVAAAADSKKLLAWVRTDVSPFFFRSFNERGYHAESLQAQLALAVGDLLRRAELLEASQKHPFDALLYCGVAGQLAGLAPFPQEGAGEEEGQTLPGQVRTVETLLRLSAFMRQHYAGVPGSTTASRPGSDRKYSCYSLAELEDAGGLQGLAFQLFDSAGPQLVAQQQHQGDGALAAFELSAFLRRLVSEFGAAYDEVCLQWVDRTVSTRVLALSDDLGSSAVDLDSSYMSRDSEASEADSGATPVTLVHLLAVTVSIADPFLRAKAMLLLLQVPAGSAAHAVTVRLYEMAEELLQVLGGTSLGDSLQEAVRSYKLSNITARYGIPKLNLRDKRQVKTAAYLIAARWQQQYESSPRAAEKQVGEQVHDQSIRDAVAFVTSRNAGGIELCTVLSRGVLLRVLGGQTPAGVRREEVVSNALKQVPAHCLKVVVENVCTHLRQEMDTRVEALAALEVELADAGARVEELRADWLGACTGTITTLSTYLDLTTLRPQGSSWCSTELLAECKSLRALHSDSGLVVSLGQIRDDAHCKRVVAAAAAKHAGALVAAKAQGAVSVQLLTTGQRRCCGVLNVSPVYFLFELANVLMAKKEISLAIEAALAMNTEKRAAATAPVESREVYRGGVLTSDGGTPSNLRRQEQYRALVARCKEEADLILSVSTAFCMSSMKLATKEVGLVTLFSTARELLKQLAINCPQKYVSSAMDYFVIADLVLAVHDRFDSQVSAGGAPHAAAGHPPAAAGDFLGILNGSLYVKDGILLSPASVLMPLLKFCLKEIQRRSHVISSLHTGAAIPSSLVVAGAPPAPGAGTSQELMDLLSQLHKSENHVLAVRVLVTSWHLDCNKYSYVYASLKALARKILTYREIDMELAVAYLGSIPDKSMVKELQAIIPTVQNDFARLKLTALIGEQLALMWDKEDLLRVFQSLQNNAKWWSALAGYGIKVDTKTFQHPVGDIRSQYIRSVVPELLQRSSMDLELAQDYCRQFDLTTEFANTCFIELILKAASSGATDSAGEGSVNSHRAWEKHVRFAASGVSQEQLLSTFRGVLKQVHEYSYAKVRYVCKWLISYLQEESEVSGDYSKLVAEASANNSAIKNKVPFGAKAAVPAPEALESVQPDPEIVKEIRLYQRYIDVIDSLVVLKIPTHLVAACSFSGGAAAALAQQDPASGMGSIPLWQLVDEPWGVLDVLLQSIMSNVSGGGGGGVCESDLAVLNNSLALKLSALCPLLLVDKDAYHVKRIKLFYGKHRKLGSNGSSSGGGSDGGLVGSIEDNMQFVDDLLCQTKLWLWVHEQETGEPVASADAAQEPSDRRRPPARLANSQLSQVALDHAVVLIRQLEAQTQALQKAKKPKPRPTATRSATAKLTTGETGGEDEDAELNLLIEVHQMKIDVQLLAVRSRCSATVRRLVDATMPLVTGSAVQEECAVCLHSLYSYVHSPRDLLTMLFCSVLVEVAWVLQLHCQASFDGSGGVGSAVGLGSTQAHALTVFEMMNTGLCASTAAFLHHCGRAADEIQQVVALVEVAAKGASKPQSSASSGALSASDSIRHAVVSKYLSEFHYSNLTNNASSGVSAGGSVERLGGMVYSGASSVASFAGTSSGDSSVCTPTDAERRRGEDVFAGFCISVLICSCANVTTRGAFVTQLENVIKDLRVAASGGGGGGGGSPSTSGGSKRIASRSKFRSALALRYISNCAGTATSSVAAVTASAMDPETHTSLLQYLYCLCELQETRLGTPVDTLTQILLPQVACGEHVSGLSARSVVNTWLYDEGENEDVLELCRDIYVACGCQDVPMWVQLIMKMFGNAQHHVMLTTLALLSRHTPRPRGGMPAPGGEGVAVTVQVEDSANFLTRLCTDGGGEFVDAVLQMLSVVTEETTTALQQTFELFKYQKQQAGSVPVATKKPATAGEEEADYVPEVAAVAQQRHVFSSLVPYFASVSPAPATEEDQEKGQLRPLIAYVRGVNNLALDHLAVTLAQVGALLTELQDCPSQLHLQQIAGHYRQLLQWGVRADSAELVRGRRAEERLVEGEQLLFAISWNSAVLISKATAAAFAGNASAYCSQALRDASVALQSAGGGPMVWRLVAVLCGQVASPAEMFEALDSVLLPAGKAGPASVRALSALLVQCICHGGCTTTGWSRVASEVLISWCVRRLEEEDGAKKALLKEALAVVMSTGAHTDKVQLQQQLSCVMDVLAASHLSITDRKVLRDLLVAAK